MQDIFVHFISITFFFFIHFQEASSQVCATRQSAQQVLYQLYTAISITELKGYAMMQFSWMLLKSLGKGNYILSLHFCPKTTELKNLTEIQATFHENRY